ncbi:hypothetical protein [Granulicella aggregans]|uniref:hypothetical protein n=1 Tax=Granulicella aggregans TaxID=474949 RepID=UPI0021E0E26D|nr:hypothetical protein [Granulicella aggregans]
MALRLVFTRFAWSIALGLFWLRADAQSPGSATAANQQEPIQQVNQVPTSAVWLKGMNGGVAFAGIHDSSIGWYQAITPGLSYEFSHRWSTDASFTFYPYRLASNQNPMTSTSEPLVSSNGVIGDTLFGFHGRFNPRGLLTTSTASLTAPTGDKASGLSTGRVTFDLSEHVEKYLRRTGLIVDAGGGDSSTLFNQLVTKDYSSLGPIAHFQAGFGIILPRRMYFRSLAYEQLPLGDQKIYSSLSQPGQPGHPSMEVVTGRKISEDNGFTSSMSIPLTEHWIFQSYYNRSLRFRIDTGYFGFTYVLKGTPIPHRRSLIDRAIREAEGLEP